MDSRKSVMATCTRCTVVSRSSAMLLIATFMFEPAKLAMNCVSASGMSILRKALDGRPDTPLSVMCTRFRSEPVRPQSRAHLERAVGGAAEHHPRCMMRRPT